MNCLLVMKIKWSLDINTSAVQRSEAARARRLVGTTAVGDDVIASTGYMKKQPVIGAIYHSVGGSDSRAFLGVLPPEVSKLCVYSTGT